MDGRGYVVMTYARCGATWLAQLLGSTGCLGRPEDWFNGIGYRNRGVSNYPLDRQGQFAQILSAGKSSNGIFGVKLSPERCDQLSGFKWAEQLGAPHFIHLSREDQLARAISEVRAAQTGQWRSTTPPKNEPNYDAMAILKAIKRQAEDEARVRLYFALNQIKPFELSYEALASDPDGAVGCIAEFIGVRLSKAPDLSQVTLGIQRDALNDEWRARFCEDFADINQMLRLQAPLQKILIHKLASALRLKW